MSPGLRFVNGQRNGFSAIGLQHILGAAALQAGQGVVHDVERVFTARIVAGQDHEVAARSGRLAHQRPLAAVAVAAASENRDDPACASPLRQKVARQRGQVAQRVVGVGVVHDDGEGLAHIDSLETSCDPVQLIGGFRDGARLDIASIGRRRAASRLKTFTRPSSGLQIGYSPLGATNVNRVPFASMLTSLAWKSPLFMP